jgi:D-3-phosphoglycerate dehydrogenase
MGKAKVLYYNIDDTLEYENSLLEKWGIFDVELVEVKDKENQKSFVEYASDADGAVVEYQLITREIMEQLPKLKVVSLQSIGYNNVDIPAATEHGICVTNAPGFCAEEVALHTVGLLIDLVRKISFFDRSVRAGQWNPLLGPKLHRITGKTIGLIFFGSIPKLMLPMLTALGLKIIVYAPTKTKEYLEGFGVEKVDTLEELLRTSDFVSLHTPLTPATRHMISEPQLKLMKPGAFLINTARGSVVDEPALVKALTDGTIAGAGIDVIENEDTEKSDLFGLENVVITPHAAFISEDSFYSAREMALEQLVQRLSKKTTPTNLVNKAVTIDFTE